jgi:hypothetical protein
MCLNGAVKADNPLADGREGRTSAAPAACFSRDRGLTQRMVDFLDQQPGSAVGHT